ncbi:MAG: LamG domain-containing protein [Chloroflexi bacterium]|nr:LamG domain-containing protein [Chloroflexota bacterium]
MFNGTNARVTVPDAADLDLTTGVTLEAWVYPTAAGGGAWRTVLTKDTAASGNYLLYANTDTNNAGMYVGSTFQQQVAGGPTVAANSWTHLTGTYDGITIRLYVNGVQVASRAQTAAMTTNNALLSIGGSSVWGEWFAGRLDELRIYNRALTAAEIQADSAAPLP